MSDCVFCKRIEDGENTDCGRGVAMFEPLNPVVRGHMLFVPEMHVVDATEKPWITGAVFEAASAWGGMAAKDFNLITSAGLVATQTVRHLHVHYVPRRVGDGLLLPWSNQIVGAKDSTEQQPGATADEPCIGNDPSCPCAHHAGPPETFRRYMERTGTCRRCGHVDEQHRRNKCHEVACDCYMSGPSDFAAGDVWNSYMGRTP